MKPFLLITGMHRSGTSFLARALNLSGVYLGDFNSLISNEWNVREDNLRGHWENKQFLELAEITLSSNNSTWDDPLENIIISEKLGEEIKKHVDELVSHPSLGAGFKDPRILLCLEGWLKYLPKDFLIVGIFRHPLKVAESLKKRNQFSYEKSLRLWKIYNMKLLSFLEQFNGFLLNFDWEKEEILSEISMISTKLNLSNNSDLSEWYSEELMHSDLSYNEEYKLSEDIQSLYSRLLERSLKNKEIKIPKFTRSLKDVLKITETLLADMQKEGEYFRGITESIRINSNEKIHQIESDYVKLSTWSKELEELIKQKDVQLDESKLYASKLENVLKEKDVQLDESKLYASKLENVLKEKSDHLLRLENDNYKKDKTLEVLERNKRKYYTSRL